MKLRLAGLGGGGAGAKTYVDDVFSTYLYTGNGSTQTITNGIDLAGKGGLVWTKARSAAYDHILVDTVRGRPNSLHSNTTQAQLTRSDISSFNSDGYSLGLNQGYENNSGINYASWTFREATKFFDVVTYTGTGSPRTIAHSLGVAPGMIIVKRTDSALGWPVYHRGLTSLDFLLLDATSGSSSAGSFWDDTNPTATNFTVGGSNYTNASGGTYVAYLFAHDTSAEGIIQCGSFTTDGSGSATVTLGYEPQWLMIKRSDASDDWIMLDVMRGMSFSNCLKLAANASSAEYNFGVNQSYPNATGFTVNGTLSANGTYIYMAIRRSNKPPTSGTQVYQGVVTGSTNFPYVITNTVVDFAIRRANKATTQSYTVSSRLTGDSYLLTTSVDEETAGGGTFKFDSMSGWYNTSLSETPVVWNFKRAPEFFDVVCYTGTGNPTTQAHNLTVVPEMMIVKTRAGSAGSWAVYSAVLGATKGLYLNSIGASSNIPTFWDNTSPTTAVFTIGSAGSTNRAACAYVAYLFATLAGISKVGSYTGNGGTQNIECGFAAGARFVLIKRTDSTGDWFVWDTARGIVAANDPHLSLNTTAAEVTTDDSIDPYSAGFTVNQVAATDINVSSATYIYLAIA